MAMAEPDHAVAVERTAPNGTVLRPTLRIHEKSLQKALGDPSVVGEQREVDVDQRIGCRETFPGGRHASEAVDDPFIPRQKIGVCLQIVFMRDLAAARSVLDEVQRMQRQSRQLRQSPGQRRLAAGSVSEHRDLLHRAGLATTTAPSIVDVQTLDLRTRRRSMTDSRGVAGATQVWQRCSERSTAQGSAGKKSATWWPAVSRVCRRCSAGSPPRRATFAEVSSRRAMQRQGRAAVIGGARQARWRSPRTRRAAPHNPTPP